MSQSPPLDNNVDIENTKQFGGMQLAANDNMMNNSFMAQNNLINGGMNSLINEGIPNPNNTANLSNVLSSQSPPQTVSRFKGDDITGNKIFVGGLSWDTTQEKLFEYFSDFGSIIDCILMLDGTTGRSRGFGFVTFLHKDAVKAVLAVKQHILDNKIIDPKEAVPKYIKDIENRINLSQSNNCHTSSYTSHGCANNCSTGAIVSGGSSVLSVAVATIKTPTINGSAKASTKASALSKRSLCIGGEQSPPISHSMLSCQHTPTINNNNASSCFLCPTVLHNTKIFVGGIGHASDADLREYFSTFGTVVDVNIMMDKATGRPRGFAFVGFSTNEAADLTASMRYHCVRNKQVEVKKALPKDTKCLSSSTANHNSSIATAHICSVAASHTNHSNIANHSNAGASENHLTPTLHKANSHKSYNNNNNNNSNSNNNNILGCDYLKMYSSSKINANLDDSLIGHEHTHIDAMNSMHSLNSHNSLNCSGLAHNSMNGGIDDRPAAAASVVHSSAYNGEWDFDDVIHFGGEPQSNMMYSTSNNLVSSPRGTIASNDPNEGMHMSNNSHRSILNLMGEPINSNSLLRHRDNPIFGNHRIGNNKSQLGAASSLFDMENNVTSANTYNPSTTNASASDRVQTMRFNSVSDTTSLLNRQIPDDTKNSIVELLNEIWKGSG